MKVLYPQRSPNNSEAKTESKEPSCMQSTQSGKYGTFKQQNAIPQLASCGPKGENNNNKIIRNPSLYYRQPHVKTNITKRRQNRTYTAIELMKWVPPWNGQQTSMSTGELKPGLTGPKPRSYHDISSTSNNKNIRTTHQWNNSADLLSREYTHMYMKQQ